MNNLVSQDQGVTMLVAFFCGVFGLQGECAKSDGQRLVSSYEVSRCQSPAELHNREGKLTLGR